jgi:glycosyltransferase involved in cell wall biosynthesis
MKGFQLIKNFALLFLIAFCFLIHTKVEPAQTVCLNMIVKNEKDVITRCLQSVLPLIDTWVIVDTGSTDGTQEIIKDFLKNIPGELHERPWVNFAHNRNEALDLAKNKADYLLIMDADDTLEIAKDFTMPMLLADFYACLAKGNGQTTLLPRFFKSGVKWKWTGALHEVIRAEEETNGLFLSGIEYIYRHDGARAKDPDTLSKDALVLESLIQKDPKDSRSLFYLAKTYQLLGKLEEAKAAFNKRCQMTGFEEEVFLSKLEIAQIESMLSKDLKKIKQAFLSAYLERPHRAESIYYLVEKLKAEKEFETGFELARLRLQASMKPVDELFVQGWIYDFGLLLQYALCAMELNRYAEAIHACNQLLQSSNLPQMERERVEFIALEAKKKQIQELLKEKK